MDPATLELIPDVLRSQQIQVLDLTGGAPELHSGFRQLVDAASKLGVEVMDRCNLTILTEPGHEYLAEFLAERGVTVIASLPCYSAANVDQQRGNGVFDRSLEGLRQLNALGYGAGNDCLQLHLVYNPQAAVLPPPQGPLEEDYKRELAQLGVRFDRLLTLANMPIKRFARSLHHQGKLDAYQALLEQAHNPQNLRAVMCRELISVDWQGNLFDCDFNQQLDLPLMGPVRHLRDLLDSNTHIEGAPIRTDRHCFGCTAGAGSSCGGALQS